MRGPDGSEIPAEGEAQPIGDGYSADWTSGYGDVDEDFDYGTGEHTTADHGQADQDTAEDDSDGIIGFLEDITGMDLDNSDDETADAGSDPADELQSEPMSLMEPDAFESTDSSDEMANDFASDGGMGPDPHDAFTGEDPADAFDILD